MAWSSVNGSSVNESIFDTHVEQAWAEMLASPSFSLAMTLGVYLAAVRLHRFAGGLAILHPVLVSIITLILLLLLLDIPYAQYFAGGQYIHLLLGPATVALAIPLYQQWDKLRSVGLIVGLVTVISVPLVALFAWGVAILLGLSETSQISMMSKSVTTPVAMAISEGMGGVASLTAVFVLGTGTLGAIVGVAVFRILGFKQDWIKGLAMGIVSHGIGTARAFQESREMGTFSGLAMALATIILSFSLPWLVDWLASKPLSL